MKCPNNVRLILVLSKITLISMPSVSNESSQYYNAVSGIDSTVLRSAAEKSWSWMNWTGKDIYIEVSTLTVSSIIGPEMRADLRHFIHQVAGTALFLRPKRDFARDRPVGAAAEGLGEGCGKSAGTATGSMYFSL